MERLQKVIAAAGVASRRKAEELIVAGKVTVNGKVVNELGVKVAPKDKICVNGVLLEKEELVYYVMNKPRGCVTTTSDDLGRATVMDYIGKKKVRTRVFPVGRLDYDTSGVLLFTNDGDFANKMMHPRIGIAKTYLARVRGIVTKNSLKPLLKGVMIEGYMTKPANFNIVSIDKENGSSLVELTIYEGRYHQVKRMFEVVGHPVKKLRREVFGNIDVNGLKPGGIRGLTRNEVLSLLRLATEEEKMPTHANRSMRQF